MLLLSFIGALLSTEVPFLTEKEQVLRCSISSRQLYSNEINLIQIFEENNIDLWSSNIYANKPFDVRVQTSEQIQVIESTGAKCSVFIPDLQTLIQEESLSTEFIANENDDQPEWYPFFRNFQPFDALISSVKELSEKYPQLTRFVPSVAQSIEKRDLAVIHISNFNNNSPKKTIWFNGGIHAREWISSHVATFLVHKLLTTYETDSETRNLLDNIEFVVSPHINPDGYEYSRSEDRMWRKNRRLNKDGSYGVDLNRNCDAKWRSGGSTHSETYPGTHAFSEPEMDGLQKYISNLNAVVGIDFHSYGQLIMRPWGNQFTDHPTESLNKKLGDGMRDSAFEKTKVKYTSQKSVGLYPAYGAFDDWFTSIGMIGFTIELRDTGRYGFVLPKEQIIPTGEEMWEALKYCGKFVLEEMDDA